MRRAARVDANQEAIVDALRVHGATVQSLAAIGAGCPDLLVGFGGQNFALEVKDPAKPPSHRRLTVEQRLWHARWQGQVETVLTSADALAAIGALPQEPL